jgi:hypothetical protein
MKSRSRSYRWFTRRGVLALGVSLLAAGCGGGSLNTPGFTPLPAPPLGTYAAGQSVAVTQGQSAIIEAPATPSENVSNVTVVLPSGALLQNATLAAAGVPSASNTIERIRLATPDLVTNIHPVAEVVFGQVVNTSTRTIVSATPILSTGASLVPTYRIKLSVAGSQLVSGLLATEGVTSAFQVLVRDEFSFNNRLIQPEGATVTYDAAQALITVRGVRANDLLVNVVQTQH